MKPFIFAIIINVLSIILFTPSVFSFSTDPVDISDNSEQKFSILNSDDPIKNLKKYGWTISSDNYFDKLGYYLRIRHKEVRNNEYIIVARRFELDKLNQDDISKIFSQSPVIFLDNSYLELYNDMQANVGGFLYKTNGEKIDFYHPLENWHLQLSSLLKK